MKIKIIKAIKVPKEAKSKSIKAHNPKVGIVKGKSYKVKPYIFKVIKK